MADSMVDYQTNHIYLDTGITFIYKTIKMVLKVIYDGTDPKG
jgi:hypothetical protein